MASDLRSRNLPAALVDHCCKNCIDTFKEHLESLRPEPIVLPSEVTPTQLRRAECIIQPTHTEQSNRNIETPKFGNKIKIRQSDFRESLYKKVLISKYNEMKKDAKVDKRIRQGAKENKIKYLVSTKIGQRLLGMAMVHAPKVGLESMATIIALVSAVTLANLGINKAHFPCIPLLNPSTNTL